MGNNKCKTFVPYAFAIPVCVLAILICLCDLSSAAFAADSNSLQAGDISGSQLDNASVEAALVPTVENGVTYKTHVQYTDYANSGKISWGEVSLFKTEPDANGVVFWFFTNPDKANHPNEVQLSFIDRSASNETEFDLVIPSTVTVQGTTYKVTAIGCESGSSYKEYAGSPYLLAYWYDPIDEFAPDWCIGPNAKTVGDMTRDSEGYLDFAIAHPYLPVAGQNPDIAAYGPIRYDVDAVRGGTVADNDPQLYKDYLKTVFTGKVKSLYIPAAVETIGSNSFAGWGMSSVTFGEGSNLNTLEAGVFQGCRQLEALDFSTTKLTSVMTPQYYRFHVSGDARGYTGTEDLNGDGNVDTQDAWYDDGYGKWTNKSGELSDSPVEYTDRSVGGYATFMNCSSLKSIMLPAGVRFGAECAAIFSGDNALQKLEVVGSDAHLSFWQKGSGSNSADRSTYGWRSFDLVDGMLLGTVDGSKMFYWIPPAMETVIVPDDVETLKRIEPGKTVKKFGAVFANTTALSHAKTIVLGRGITSLENDFSGNPYVEEIRINPECTTINFKDWNTSPFRDASNLKSIYLGGISNLIYRVFDGCESLQNVVIESESETFSLDIACFAINPNRENSYETVNIYLPANAFVYSLSSNSRVKEGESWTNSAFNYQGTDGAISPSIASNVNVYGSEEAVSAFVAAAGSSGAMMQYKKNDGTYDDITLNAIDYDTHLVKYLAGPTSAAVSTIDAQDYTGSAIEPAVAATYGSGDEAVTLVEGTDYTVEYANNMKPGTATVTVKGMGDYVGTMSASFAIADTEDGKAAADEAAVKALVEDVAKLPAADEITADNPDAIAAVEDAVNAYSGMNDVQKADIGADTLSALVTAQAKVAEAKQQIADEALQAEKEAKEAAQKEAAEAKAQAEQLKADVEAAKAQAAASASLAKPALTAKTKSKKKGKLTAAWSKVAGADGYELKVGKKTYTVKGGAKVSKTVKAKKGKKVKVQVRAFKRQGDNTVYSAWSKAKKVKVKK